MVKRSEEDFVPMKVEKLVAQKLKILKEERGDKKISDTIKFLLQIRNESL